MRHSPSPSPFICACLCKSRPVQFSDLNDTKSSSLVKLAIAWTALSERSSAHDASAEGCSGTRVSISCMKTTITLIVTYAKAVYSTVLVMRAQSRPYCERCVLRHHRADLVMADVARFNSMLMAFLFVRIRLVGPDTLIPATACPVDELLIADAIHEAPRSDSSSSRPYPCRRTLARTRTKSCGFVMVCRVKRVQGQ
jgi:hypothetical protein